MLVLGAIGYLVPLPATADAVASMSGDAAVRVESSPTRIVLTPSAAPKAGLVFLPGAKVDPRAYVPLLTQVSAAGYLVVIVKEPYDIGFLSTGEPAKVVAATPGVTRWAVGGHSLGGVAAGSLWATGLRPVRGCCSGRRTRWARWPTAPTSSSPPSRVPPTASARRPTSSPAGPAAAVDEFTAVAGGVHAYFGDYGTQPGDGTPGVDRATAQQQIVAASVTFMDAVAAGG